MAAQGGFGLTAEIDVTATPTTIVGIKDLEFPKLKGFLAESTSHDAASGYYTAVHTGKRRAEPLKMVLFWDSSEATHGAVTTAFNGDVPVSFTVADPDGDETLSFEVLIEEILRISPQEDAYTAEIMVHPTGAVTIS